MFIISTFFFTVFPEYLQEAMKICQCAKAIESLSLQHDSHKKAENIINSRRGENNCLKEKLEKDSETIMEAKPTNIEQPHSSDSWTEELQAAIYKTINTQDSLLQFLFQDSMPSVIQQSKDEMVKSAIKIPKNDKMIIEELRTNNEELKKMMKSMIEEIEMCKKENVQLREELRNYQKEST